VPEVTFALSEQVLGGWTSEGRTFGDRFFLGEEPTLTPAQATEIIRALIARLP
jgi:hypothetical protein